jgi:hypothetical protein
MANPDDELDLPDLDGESDEPTEAPHDLDEPLDVVDTDDGADAFDDAAAGDSVDHGIALGEGAEGGLLADSEDAAGLDVGAFDLSIGVESEDLRDDATQGRGEDPDLDTGDEGEGVDAGEEGPTDDDEELREEDLPALDADEDGDVADDELFDKAAILSEGDELRWDDRAWTKVDVAPRNDESDAPDESGTLSLPGEDPQHKARDDAWKVLEETGRTMATVYLPGESVVVALATPDWERALLVRIAEDGAARIIAEIDPREDTGDACKVTHLRWDAAGNRLIVYGSFGVSAFRPS